MEIGDIVKIALPIFIIGFKIIYAICQSSSFGGSSYSSSDSPYRKPSQEKPKSNFSYTTENRQSQHSQNTTYSHKKQTSYEDTVLSYNAQDPYKILGIHGGVEWSIIQKAYRKMAMLHHPDRHVNKSKAERETAERNMKIINNAYITLKKRFGKN